jgi:hypothetical protein
MDTYSCRIVDRLDWKLDGNRYLHYQNLFESILEVDVRMSG